MSEAAALAEPESPADWWVQVRGQAFGPYTMEQLAAYVREGRIRPATPVTQNRDGPWTEARKIEALMAPFRALTQPAAPAAAPDVANIFIYAEINSSAWNAFTAALKSMGDVCQMAPGLWLLRTRFSAGVMRNTLSQTLERGDRFVVIDASRDRLAWFNLGPELDVRIKDVWNTPLKR